MIVLTIAADAPPVWVEQLLLMAHRFPGAEELTIVSGKRRLTLGPASRYDGSPACLAAMREFGDIEC